MWKYDAITCVFGLWVSHPGILNSSSIQSRAAVDWAVLKRSFAVCFLEFLPLEYSYLFVQCTDYEVQDLHAGGLLSPKILPTRHWWTNKCFVFPLCHVKIWRYNLRLRFVSISPRRIKQLFNTISCCCWLSRSESFIRCLFPWIPSTWI